MHGQEVVLETIINGTLPTLFSLNDELTQPVLLDIFPKSHKRSPNISNLAHESTAIASSARELRQKQQIIVKAKQMILINV